MTHKACATCGCPDRRWLCVKEVARVMMCSPRTVRRKVADGTLRAVSCGGLKIIHQSVHELMEKEGALPAISA